MGLAQLGYILVLAGGLLGLVLWLMGRRRESNRMVTWGSALFFLGILGLVAWGIYLQSLRHHVSYLRVKADEVRLLMAGETEMARHLGRKPDYSGFDQGPLEDEARARRTVRLYGWKWEELGPAEARVTSSPHSN